MEALKLIQKCKMFFTNSLKLESLLLWIEEPVYSEDGNIWITLSRWIFNLIYSKLNINNVL